MNKHLAVFLSVATLCLGCATPGKRTAEGAGAGAAGGAAAGAAIGAAAGNAGKGAWIGAAAGSVLGSMIGNRLDRQAKQLAEVAETQRTENGILTKLKNDLLFDFDSATVKPEAKSDLDQIADIVKQYPEDHLMVVGYTDNKGTQTYNQELSERRARAVKLALVSNGVPASSVEAMGMGEANPIAPNGTEAGRSRNRRVEMTITPDASKVRS